MQGRAERTFGRPDQQASCFFSRKRRVALTSERRDAERAADSAARATARAASSHKPNRQQTQQPKGRLPALPGCLVCQVQMAPGRTMCTPGTLHGLPLLACIQCINFTTGAQPAFAAKSPQAVSVWGSAISSLHGTPIKKAH